MYNIVCILVGFASMPPWDTMCNPVFCLAWHYVTQYSLYCFYASCMLANVSTRSDRWSSLFLLMTTMSLTYVKMLRPICFSGMFLVNLENMEPTFSRPSGIQTKQYVTKGVIKLVFPCPLPSCKFGGSPRSSPDEALLRILPLSRQFCLFFAVGSCLLGRLYWD